ncbi:hypothetical protein BBJ28_00026601, partial [Nothophytophthora sp. Chile5]
INSVNGIRIKTITGLKGLVSGATYTNNKLSNVKNAIVIHSDYNKTKGGYSGSATSLVTISNITIDGLSGSAINLYDIVANSKVVSNWKFSGITVNATKIGRCSGQPGNVQLRAVAALATALTGLLTILIAFAIARANHVYLGGLAWPFISDLGRDPPGSYVFFFGLNIVAVLLGFTWSFNHDYKHRFLQQSFENGQVSSLICSLSYVSSIFGVVGAFGLPVFASFNASPAMHFNSAFGFLLCEAVAMVINTYLNYRIFLVKRFEMDSGVFITDRYGPRSVSRIKLSELQAVKQGFLIELVCVALFMMCVIVYLPVLYDSTDTPHLTIAQVRTSPRTADARKCIEKKLGENYCSSTMRLDDTYTTLWDYGMLWHSIEV